MMHGCPKFPYYGNVMYQNSNDKTCDHCGADLQKERYEEALRKIIATSHSWVITHETGAIEKPIHDKYREIAKKALGQ